MMMLRDAFVLAGTKFQTRKIRLLVTVILSSLLFAALSFFVLVGDGAIHSAQNFGKEGYGGQYLIRATPLNGFVNDNDSELIKYFEPIQKELIAKKKAEAKKLGIEYDPASDQLLPITITQSAAGREESYLNNRSPIVSTEVNRRIKQTPGITYESFVQEAAKHSSKATFNGISAQSPYALSATATGSLTSIINGKEQTQYTLQSEESDHSPKGLDTLPRLGWRGMDSRLLAPFVLDGQTLSIGADGSLPIIAPFSAAEEMLGMRPLPATAAPKEKIERLQRVRQAIAGKTTTLCYRNTASLEKLNEALTQQKDILANKSNKEYVKPDLLYRAPNDACGAIEISRDSRSPDEKKRAHNRLLFDKQFNGYTDPVQGVIAIRIVGLSLDVDYQSSVSASTIMTSLLSSSLGYGWVSPNEAFGSNAYANAYIGGSVKDFSPINMTYYAEFPDLAHMESFIKSQACDDAATTEVQPGQTIGATSASSSIKDCIVAGKVFAVSPYGNSAGAIEQFRSMFWKLARYVMLVIISIAVIVLMGTVGKIVADSRRETAVFRALGAKRIDIAQIYMTYVALVSLSVAVLSLIIGAIAAQILNTALSPGLSVNAVMAYGAADVDKKFILFGVNSAHIAYVVLLVMIAGILSAIPPLASNLRRSPIRDMRDES